MIIPCSLPRSCMEQANTSNVAKALSWQRMCPDKAFTKVDRGRRISLLSILDTRHVFTLTCVCRYLIHHDPCQNVTEPISWYRMCPDNAALSWRSPGGGGEPPYHGRWRRGRCILSNVVRTPLSWRCRRGIMAVAAGAFHILSKCGE